MVLKIGRRMRRRMIVIVILCDHVYHVLGFVRHSGGNDLLDFPEFLHVMPATYYKTACVAQAGPP